jgi:hypothetical protein
MNNYWELTKSFPNEANQEMVGEFLLSLKLANCSQRSIYLYRSFLENFFGDRKEPFFSLSSDSIKLFRAFLFNSLISLYGFIIVSFY